jgi:hypothetical protein
MLKADVCLLFHNHLPVKMEPTEGSETSALNIQTPRKYPEEYIPLHLSLSIAAGHLLPLKFTVTELILLNVFLFSLFVWCPHANCELACDVSTMNISAQKKRLIGFPSNFTVRKDVNS